MDANHDSVCARAVRCARAAIAPTHVEHGERRSRATVRDEGAMKGCQQSVSSYRYFTFTSIPLALRTPGPSNRMSRAILGSFLGLLA